MTIQLELFHIKAANEKVHYKVMWKRYKEITNDWRLLGYSKEAEVVMAKGIFITKAGAEGYVMNLKHLSSYANWFEILEYK